MGDKKRNNEFNDKSKYLQKLNIRNNYNRIKLTIHWNISRDFRLKFNLKKCPVTVYTQHGTK